MKQIKFKSDDKPFNVMAEDERFMVCSRVYTRQESIQECKKWDEELEEYLEDGFHLSDNYTEFELYEDSMECTEREQEFNYIKGERPTEYDEDTQCYTIVDKVEEIRGADNYYNKFNYLEKKECEMALYLLNNGLSDFDFRISRRNRISLDIEEIKE